MFFISSLRVTHVTCHWKSFITNPAGPFWRSLDPQREAATSFIVETEMQIRGEGKVSLCEEIKLIDCFY